MLIKIVFHISTLAASVSLVAAHHKFT